MQSLPPKNTYTKRRLIRDTDEEDEFEFEVNQQTLTLDVVQVQKKTLHLMYSKRSRLTLYLHYF